MTEEAEPQPVPRLDPLACGLWANVRAAGQVREREWAFAAADGSTIGTCRVCGGYLVADDPKVFSDGAVLRWFVARCLDCGHEFASPNGRLLRRSGRLSERISP